MKSIRRKRKIKYRYCQGHLYTEDGNDGKKVQNNLLKCYLKCHCESIIQRNIDNNRIDGNYHDQTHSAEYQEDYFGEFNSI